MKYVNHSSHQPSLSCWLTMPDSKVVRGVKQAFKSAAALRRQAHTTGNVTDWTESDWSITSFVFAFLWWTARLNLCVHSAAIVSKWLDLLKCHRGRAVPAAILCFYTLLKPTTSFLFTPGRRVCIWSTVNGQNSHTVSSKSQTMMHSASNSLIQKLFAQRDFNNMDLPRCFQVTSGFNRQHIYSIIRGINKKVKGFHIYMSGFGTWICSEAALKLRCSAAEIHASVRPWRKEPEEWDLWDFS